MRLRPLLAGLLIGASGLSFLPSPAVGQRVDLGALGLVPEVPETSDKPLVGLPERAAIAPLTWERVYAPALVRARSGGAGPAEAIDPKALDEQARRHGVADFARFRKEFLSGRAEGGAFHDPAPAYYAVLRQLRRVDDARRYVATLANLSKLLQEMIQGEAAGLGQYDLDLTSEALERGRRRLSREVAGFRDALDELKVSLGLSPHATVVPDRREIAAFRDAFESADAWSRKPDRNLSELPRVAERLPATGEVTIVGRPILVEIERDPSRLEEALRDAARLALKEHADGGAALEVRVRRRVRRLLDLRLPYEREKRRYLLAVRLKDQAFERLLAPPPGQAVSMRTPAVPGLIEDLGRVPEAEDRLVAAWASFRAERLALYRDLGALPYDNWESFLADLAARPGPSASPGEPPRP